MRWGSATTCGRNQSEGSTPAYGPLHPAWHEPGHIGLLSGGGTHYSHPEGPGHICKIRQKTVGAVKSAAKRSPGLK